MRGRTSPARVDCHLKLLPAALNLLIIASGLGPGSCWAAGAARAATLEQIVLDNGLCVLFQPNAGTSTVAVCALAQVRASRESRLTAGIRQLLAQVAGSPGSWPETAGRRPTALQVQSAASRDYVELLVQCLPPDFPAALQLIRRQLFEPQLTRERFEAARAETVRAIRVSRQLPVALALSKMAGELYPRQPGSWSVNGSIAAMSAITLEQAQRFQRDYFRPNATVLGISGDLAAAQVEAQVRSCFDDLLPGKTAPGREPFSPHPTIEAPRRLIMRGVDSSVIVLAGRAPTLADPDYPAAAGLSVLLGAGMGSRLFQVLRAERSLAYTVQAALTPSQVCSYAYVLATCSFANLAATQATIERQLADIIEQGVSEAELARARQFVITSFMLNMQRNRDLAHYAGVFYASGGPEGLATYQQFAARIEKVSAGQVQELCTQIFARPAIIIVEGSRQPRIGHSPKNRLD